MIQNLILSLGLSFAIGLNGAKDNNNNFINNDTPNNVVYNDDNLYITFNSNELNTYTWENLAEYLNLNLSSSDLSGTYIYYGAYTTDEYFSNPNLVVNDYVEYINSTDNLSFIRLDFVDTYNFMFINNDEDDVFTDNITWNLNEGTYYDIKDAIELDIAANSTPTLSDFQSILNAIISLLVGGITGMASGLGSGINSTISALAIENGSMSIFLGVVAIFGGIALAVGLTRRIFAWIQNLGGRN